MIKNRRVVLWGSVILLVLASAAGWNQARLKSGPAADDDLEAGSASGNNAATSLTRAQAEVIFAKERIEFAEDCRTTPHSMSAKSGATLMFDNVSRDAVEFRLDGAAYSLPGYGFKLLQLKSDVLPHTVKVVCGNKAASEIILR